jgi:hypothetical protein
MSMNNEFYEALEKLTEVLKQHAPKDAVSCDVFINYTGYEWSIKCRSATNLLKNGIAMKNIVGEWIK